MFKSTDSNEMSSARGYDYNRREAAQNLQETQGVEHYVARVVDNQETTTPPPRLILEDVEEETVIQTTESLCSREFKTNFHFNSTSFNYIEQLVLDSSSDEPGLQMIDTIQQEEHQSSVIGLTDISQDAEFLIDRIETKPDSKKITRTLDVSVRHTRPAVPYEATELSIRRDLLPKPDRGTAASPLSIDEHTPTTSSIFIKKERRVIPINQTFSDVKLVDPNQRNSYTVEYVDQSTKELQRAEVQRQLTYLGVVDADPVDYHSRYASELKDPDQMAEYAWDVDEYATRQAQEHAYDYYDNEYGLPELEGDIEALSLIPDLDAVGLGMYKPMLDKLKQKKQQQATVLAETDHVEAASNSVLSRSL